MFSAGGVTLDITEGKLFLLFIITYGRYSVPTRRLSMLRIKEVLRLRFELGLEHWEIARACAISQGAVHNYLKKVAAAGIPWPQPEGWDEKRVERAKSGRTLSRASPSEFSFPPRTVAATSPSDTAVGMGSWTSAFKVAGTWMTLDLRCLISAVPLKVE
jgi:hypothetical protein